MAPFPLFPRVAVLYTGWIYTLARNTQIPLVAALILLCVDVLLLLLLFYIPSLLVSKGVFYERKACGVRL